jgi:ribonucleoside-triphosphate reductase (formate)
MNLSKIQKRNGTIVSYTPEKIVKAIKNAAAGAQYKLTEMNLDIIISHVEKELSTEFSEQIPHVEQIQDLVEESLIHFGHAPVAKAYILYRDTRRKDREDRQVTVDVTSTIDEYLKRADWRVNANSNQGYSLGGMILNTSGKVTANYWLSRIYPEAIGTAHRNADIHVHDLDMFSGYCAGWSLRALLEEGFNGIDNKTESDPPKHLGSALAQMVNFLGTLQNEWAGAQAFSSFDTYLAPFVRKHREEMADKFKPEHLENEVYRYVKQHMQSFIFNLNVPSRWGTQTPFTNITLDLQCPVDLKDKRLLLGGDAYKYTYGELEDEMRLINRAFVEIMSAGDARGRTFTFPIPTYNITKDFDWENKDYLPIFEMTAKYGTPYFQNFINSDLDPGDVRSMCCRLQLDLKELRKRGGGLFGSAEMTGSIGVVTVNAARIGYTHKDSKEEFFAQLDHLMNLAKTSLEIKRTTLQEWLKKGLYPYTKRYLGGFNNHFSTIGINGVNEAIRNFTDDVENISTPKGQELALEILDHMRDKMAEYQEETGHMYNLEATPAEGTTYRFAKEDKARYPEILQAGTKEAPYYTNSSQLPVGFTDDVFQALDLQDKLQTKYTGGTVLHCYMSERISSGELCRDLVKRILSGYKLPYITITPTFSICPKHGYLDGEHDYCPKCDEQMEIKLSTIDDESRKKYVEQRVQPAAETLTTTT